MASTRSSTSSARARRRRSAQRVAARRRRSGPLPGVVVSHGPLRSARGTCAHAVARHQASSSSSTPRRGARVGEGGRAHLDRRRPGHEQLDGVPAVGTPPTPTMAGRAGRRARRRRPGPPPGGWPGPTGRRRPRPSSGRRVSGSMAMPSTVLTSVTASAPAAAAASATSARSATFGLSLAQRGRPHAGATAATTSAVAAGEWANMRRAVLEVGARQLTSTATTSAGAGQQAGGLAKSSTVRPQMLTTTRAPAAEQRRQVVRRARLDARALETDAVEHPGRRSGDPGRGVAGPRLGRQRLDHHRPQRGEVEVGGASSSPCPAVPDAVITGLGSVERPDRGRRGRPSPAVSAAGLGDASATARRPHARRLTGNRS